MTGPQPDVAVAEPARAAPERRWSGTVAPPWQPALLSVAVSLAYLLGFAPLHDEFGAAAAGAVLLPVGAIGWSFGQRAGVIAGGAALPLNLVLLGLAGTLPWDVITVLGGIPATISAILVGSVFGWMGEVTKRMELQSRELHDLYGESDRRRAEAEALARAVRLVAEAPLSGDTLQRIVEAATEVVPAHVAALCVPAEDGASLEVRALAGGPLAWLGRRYATTLGISGRAYRTGQVQLVEDVRKDRDYLAWTPEIRSALSIPLVARGAVLGVIHLESAEVGTFGTRDAEQLRAFAASAAVALESDRLLRERGSRANELAALNEALRISEERLRAVVTRAPLVLFAIDRSGTFTLSEGHGLAALGLRPGEVVGRSAFAVYAENPEILADLHRALAGEEFAATIRLGETSYEVAYAPYRDAAGTVAGVIGVAVDVSERLRAQDELRVQRDLYEALLRAQSDLGEVLMLNQAERILYFNDALPNLTGYSRRELEAIPSFVELAAPDERSVLEARLRSYPGESQQFQTAVRRKDGRRVDLEVSLKRFSMGGKPASVVVARDVTQRRRAEQALAYQAMHDTLTGLPNRNLLLDRLEQALAHARRQRSAVGLLLLDIDHFKDVNDSFGHQAGDILLRQVGPRLRDVLRETDTVARLGADEFALLLPGADAAGALRVAENVMRDLQRPIVVEGQALDVSASIGAVAFPEHGEGADTLMRRADLAMYLAKRSGTGVAPYAAALDPQGTNRLALMAELRAAIDRDELALHYQPLVDLRAGRVVGAEALARWPHPTRGLLPPAEFIPLAERTGLIGPLSRWVLAAALRQGRAWHEAGQRVRLAVNLSARNLLDPQLPQLVSSLLAQWQVPPESLSLEITESVVMDDPERSRDVLARLRAAGVRLAIDDFGTGYSSLAYLNRLPVHEIKIDKFFVRGMTVDESNAAIVRSIVELGHTLGLSVVAEGVEDAQTTALLRAVGCDLVQGFHIARPMPADEVTGWLGREVRAVRV